jgi:hypothetical protein
MSAFPETTVRVTSIEPAGESKVRITVELIVDVHRLAEVGSDLLHASIKHTKTTQKKK